MGDLIYWSGQLCLVVFELLGLISIVVLVPLWVIGAGLELAHKAYERYRLYKFFKKPVRIFDPTEKLGVEDLGKAYEKSQHIIHD